MNALTLKDVTVQVGDFHLKEIGLTLEKGKVLGLVGRSGAGKTTLVKTITGVLERQAGTILYQGRHLDEDAVLVKRILGVVYDRPHFNIQGKPDALVKALRPYYPDFDQELYAAKMAEYGMNGRRRFASYSRGMQKRFMILLALCLRPEILLLDEPTSEMDPVARREILDLLHGFLEDGTRSVLFSTHITSDLEQIADEVALLEEGVLLFQEDLESFRDRFSLVHFQGEGPPPAWRDSVVGVTKTALGFAGLGVDPALRREPGVRWSRPTIEDVMQYAPALRALKERRKGPLHFQKGGVDNAGSAIQSDSWL